jgi:hypothetical protein
MMGTSSEVAHEDALLRRAKQYDEEALAATYDEYALLVCA